MKVAVTGATRLCRPPRRRQLAERRRSSRADASWGWRVRAAVRCRAGVRSTSPIRRRASSAGRPDVLLHLAWGGLPNYRSLHHFERELPRICSLEKRLRNGLSTLVVAGTCLEYGMQSGPLSDAGDAPDRRLTALAKDTLRRRLQALQPTRPFSDLGAAVLHVRRRAARDRFGRSCRPRVASGQRRFRCRAASSCATICLSRKSRAASPISQSIRLIVGQSTCVPNNLFLFVVSSRKLD